MSVNAIIDLESLPELLETNNEGYKSWGKVEILAAAKRDVSETTYTHKEFSNSDASIFLEELFTSIFKKHKKAKSILITKQTNASQLKEEVPPILDDQAQLLGPTLRYVQLDTKNAIKKIVKSLNGRYAVVLSNELVVCIGKNMEETYVAAQLVEKTAKAFLEAKYLGGAKGINKIEAWVMHKFYLMKYSKESEKNR